MSSNNTKSNPDVFDAIFDLAFKIVDLLFDFVFFLFGWCFDKIFNKFQPPKVQTVTEADIRLKKRTTDSRDLGISSVTKKPIRLTDLKPHLHTLSIGSTGWGKSNTQALLFENSINRGLPIIYIDPKGSRQSINEFTSLCSYYKKDCYVFSELAADNTRYDLFHGLSNDQIVTAIMRSIDWSEIYYKARSQSFLFRAVNHLKAKSIPVTLISIFEYLESDFGSDKELAGLRANLEMIVNSSFARLIHLNKEDIRLKRVISLSEIKRRRCCLYIGLSTQGMGEIARTFGKLFLNGVLMLSHHAGINYEHSSDAIKDGISFFIDEAGSMIFPDFIELLNKCRSSGINVYACIQSLADFDVISPEFKMQCFENFGTTIIMKQAEPENAEYLAKSIGTVQSMKTTSMQEDGNETGKGSIRESKEYICHPNVLKQIGIGQIVMVRRNPYKVELVNVRYVSDSVAFKKPIKNKIVPIHKPLEQRLDEIEELVKPKPRRGYEDIRYHNESAF